MWVSVRPALHGRPDSPGVPRVRGRVRSETQCKNAKVNKEWLLLRNQRRERARETGGPHSAYDNFDKLVYFQKLGLINTFVIAVILQTEHSRLIPWAKWKIEILRGKKSIFPPKKGSTFPQMSKKRVIECKVLFWCKWGSAGRLGSRDRWRKLEFLPILIAICWTVKTTVSVFFCRQVLVRLLWCYSLKPLVRLLQLSVRNLSRRSAILLINVASEAQPELD